MRALYFRIGALLGKLTIGRICPSWSFSSSLRNCSRVVRSAKRSSSSSRLASIAARVHSTHRSKGTDISSRRHLAVTFSRTLRTRAISRTLSLHATNACDVDRFLHLYISRVIFAVLTSSASSVSRASATMFSEGDLGVLPPLGVFDPLGLIETRDMRRYEIMEIKHGRAAMLGFLHVIAIEAGVRVPGYLSTSQNLKFSDVPAGCFASLEAVPTAGWLQIMVLTCMQEAGTGFASKPQTDDAEAGDIALDSWVRYDDPEVKSFKLNAERQNGRAAMLGITGCLIHELLGVDALYPTGGLGGAAPPTIF